MDHVAIRTPGTQGFDLGALEGPILEAGYRRFDTYIFKVKGLRAASYSHEGGGLPRIFVSELVVDSLDDAARLALESCVARQSGSCARHLWEGHRWQPATATEYDVLSAKSEYAAWVAAFGIRVNHFTLGLNQLDGIDSLGELCARLRGAGIELNGGEVPIQGSPSAGLEQCSTVAQLVPHVLGCGAKRRLRGCYVEFARRYVDAAGVLFDGFIAGQADKIFESTDMRRAGVDGV